MTREQLKDALGWLVIGLLALSAWIVTPAEARPAAHVQTVRLTNDGRYEPVLSAPKVRHVRKHQRRTRHVRAARVQHVPTVVAEAPATPVIAEMRRYLGGNPTGWARVWCGKMLDMVLRATGHRPGSPRALDYARYGRAAIRPEPGTIAVWRHHVGVVTAVSDDGRRIRVISGNDGHRVRERWRSPHGVIAWRRPQ